MILLYRVLDPAPIVAALGLHGSIDLDQFGPPSGWPTDIAEGGYAVIRETWKGLDVLPGPVTPAQIAALPDPGPDPAVIEATKQATVHGILDTLRATPIDPVALDANLALAAAALAIPDPAPADLTGLAAYLALPTPTAAQTAAATQAMIRVLSQWPKALAAERATIAVLADVIRFLLARG